MKILIIILLSVLTIPLYSFELFESPVSNDNYNKVEMIFSEISSHLVVTSGFSQGKTISRLNRTINSSGKMIFDSTKGIAWQIIKPFPSITILTDNAMIQKSPGGQVRTMSAEGNDTFYRFSKTIQAVFLGRMEIILDEYDLFYIDSGKGKWQIGLQPKDSALNAIVTAFEIQGENFIQMFKIYESNGDEILYEFENIIFPEELTQVERYVFE